MADITYILNDPSTPELATPVALPQTLSAPLFKVDGYIGATSTMYTLEHQAAMCFYTIATSVPYVNLFLPKPITKWAATHKLFVQPRAGKQLNAYYDRQALRFFYALDPVTKNTIYSSNSTDVVSHELGHAILDAVRPDLYNLQAMEVWAFHESFGDILALINLLRHDLALETILKETGGDLRKPNTISKLAEEMGTAIYNLTGGKMGHTAGVMRSALNSFKYVEPEKLPHAGKDNQLTSEPHSFSRIFTGAWYDILCGIFDDMKKEFPPKKALEMAHETMAKYIFGALPYAPATIKFYNAVARAMLVVDKANGYKYNKLMNDVFISRGILRNVVRPMVSMNWEFFRDMVEPSDQVLNNSAVIAVRNAKVETLALPDFMMNVEAPADNYYEFDGTGECVNVVASSGEEMIDHARECVDFLKKQDMIRPDALSPFELDNEGNLRRNHFACGCGNTTPCGCNRNCEDPQAPEYGKCWKSQNNSGCGCNAKKSDCETTASTTQVVITNKKIR
jgi:hypothetical protein